MSASNKRGESDVDVVARAVVTATDKNAEGTSLPRWQQAAPLVRRAAELVHGLSGAEFDTTVRPMGARETQTLYARSAELLQTAGRELRPAIRDLAEEIRVSVRIIYFSAHEGLQSLDWGKASNEVDSDTQLHFILPFRDRSSDHSRARNLSLCLASLRNQLAGRANWKITVVESDTKARFREMVAPHVENYLFHSSKELFNKSAALNAGVQAFGKTGETLVLLDIDVVLAPNFISTTRQRLKESANFVPANSGLFLDAASSTNVSKVLMNREASSGPLSGYLLANPRGLCVVSRFEHYESIGGFDESFEGWGGEDTDFHQRLDSAFGVGRFDGVLIHLNHDRPDMTAYAASVR
jgi:hypothetical protein